MPNNSHTFRAWETSLPLLTVINHRVEPRAPSHGSEHAGDSVPGSTPAAVCTVVYPEVYRVYIPGVYIGGVHRVGIHQGSLLPVYRAYTPG